jgi:hypothetical protein
MVPLAYFGPETTLPLVSILATTIGGLMIFGRRTFALVRRLWGAMRNNDPTGG